MLAPSTDDASNSALPIQPLSPLPPELILPEDRAVDLWDRICAGVKNYGFAVSVQDLGVVELTGRDGILSARLPKTGSFDGLSIAVSPALSLSERVFTLLHLFGHSVQCCSPSESRIVQAFFQTPADSEDKLRVLADYEFRAAQFGLRLLHELGQRDLDHWFTAFVHTDHRMVAHTYIHRTAPALYDCLVTDGPTIEPAAIPADLKPKLVARVSAAY